MIYFFRDEIQDQHWRMHTADDSMIVRDPYTLQTLPESQDKIAELAREISGVLMGQWGAVWIIAAPKIDRSLKIDTSGRGRLAREKDGQPNTLTKYLINWLNGEAR